MPSRKQDPPPDELPELLTVRQTARFLNVCERTVYNWAGAGKIPVIVLNAENGDSRSLRFRKSDLLKWLDSRVRRIKKVD
jgi:excisionase family DNA binding protein